MTTVVVLLIGAGALLISSSLDCSSLRDTFMKIVNGDTIDYSGNNGCTGAATTTPGAVQGGGADFNNTPAAPVVGGTKNIR